MGKKSVVSRLAWPVCGLTLALIFCAVVLAALNRYDGFLTFLLAEATAAVVGGFIASRRPENPVGWLISAHALLFTLGEFTRQYAIYGLLIAPGSLPLATAAASPPHWIWFPGLMLMVVFLPLYFPDGRLVSPRWRPVAHLAVLATVLMTVTAVFNPVAGEVEVIRPDTGELLSVSNPLGVEGFRDLGLVSDVLRFVVPASWTALGAIAAASLVVRFRRSRGAERQQIKWVAYAVLLIICFSVLNLAVVGDLVPAAVSDLVFVVALEGLWLSIAVAVLRYRLYDIDVLINRTLVYAVLTAALAAVYVGSVVLLQYPLRAFGGESSFAVVASTLLIAALFNPLRRHVQALVDRRFYRGKYDAGRVLADFSAGLRDATDLDRLNGDLLGVVNKTVQPEHASVWLRAPEERR